MCSIELPANFYLDDNLVEATVRNFRWPVASPAAYNTNINSNVV